jgi:hypothetical protein
MNIEPSSVCDMNCIVRDDQSSDVYILKRPNKDNPKPRSLAEIIGVYNGGPNGRRSGDSDHTPKQYEGFLDFVQ